MPSDTPIQPILVGDAGEAMKLSARLWDAGIQVTAIRPPTVPPGTARLRVTLSAAHAERDVDIVLTTLENLRPAS
jgi:8-amino-7-oxononanoate synthase